MPIYYEMTTLDGSTVIVLIDGVSMTSFTENPDNADWQAYQEWLAEGNTPEPWPPAE